MQLHDDRGLKIIEKKMQFFKPFIMLTIACCLSVTKGHLNNCSYTYVVVPEAPQNCNPLGQNLTLTCCVCALTDYPYQLRWYKSTEPDIVTALLEIETDVTTLKSTYACYSDYVIMNFSAPDNGYYWCQVVINGSHCLNRSRPVHIGVDNIKCCMENSTTTDLCAGSSYSTNQYCSLSPEPSPTRPYSSTGVSYSNEHSTGNFVSTYPYAKSEISSSPQLTPPLSLPSFAGSLPETSLVHSSMPTVSLPFTAAPPDSNIITHSTSVNFTSTSTTNMPPSPSSLKDEYVYIIVGVGAFTAGIISCTMVGGLWVCIHRRKKKKGKRIKVATFPVIKQVAERRNLESPADEMPLSHLNSKSVSPIPDSTGDRYTELDRQKEHASIRQSAALKPTRLIMKHSTHTTENTYEEGRGASLSQPLSARSHAPLSTQEDGALLKDSVSQQSDVDKQQVVSRGANQDRSQVVSQKSEYAEPITRRVDIHVYDTVCDTGIHPVGSDNVYSTPPDAATRQPKTRLLSSNTVMFDSSEHVYSIPPDAATPQPKTQLPSSNILDSSENVYSTPPDVATFRPIQQLPNSNTLKLDSYPNPPERCESKLRQSQQKTKGNPSKKIPLLPPIKLKKSLPATSDSKLEEHIYTDPSHVVLQHHNKGGVIETTCDKDEHYYHCLESAEDRVLHNEAAPQHKGETDEETDHHYHTLEEWPIGKKQAKKYTKVKMEIETSPSSEQHHYHSLEGPSLHTSEKLVSSPSHTSQSRMREKQSQGRGSNGHCTFKHLSRAEESSTTSQKPPIKPMLGSDRKWKGAGHRAPSPEYAEPVHACGIRLKSEAPHNN